MNPPNQQGQNGQPGQNPSNPLPPEVRIAYDTKPFDDLVSAVKQQADEQKSENKYLQSIVEYNNVSENKADVNARKANKISRWSVGINAVIMAATCLIFYLNIGTAQDATRAADAADSSVRQAVRANNLTEANIKSSNEDSKKRFTMDSANMSEQIKVFKGSLAENKREFDVESQPYIEVLSDSVRPIMFEIGQPVVIRYSLGNLKYITTKVVSMQATVGVYTNGAPDFKKEKRIIDSLLKADRGGNINRFLTREAPIHGFGKSEKVLGTYTRKNILDGLARIYLIGGVKFENLDTHKMSYYYFEVEITASPLAYHIDFLENFNSNR